jgi:hypothetical protein
VTGPEIQALATEGAGFIQSCAGAVSEFAADPIGWLVGQGLDFLMAVVQPLQDLIHTVSGDGPALADAAENFGNIGQGLAAFGQKFAEDSVSALREWDGEAAKAAAVRFAEFGKGVAGAAGQAGDIARLLQISSMVMTVIEEFIKALLTEFITWLIMIWIPALAAAVPSCGASTAAAGTATGVRAAQTGARATKQVGKLQRLLDKIKEILSNLRSWMGQLKTNFRQVMDAGKLRSELATAEVRRAASNGGRTDWGTRLYNADGGMVGERLSTGFGRSMRDVAATTADETITGKDAVQGHIDGAANAAEYDATGEERSTAATRDLLDF